VSAAWGRDGVSSGGGGGRDGTSTHTDVAVDKPGICGPAHGTADPNQTVLLSAREQRSRRRVCLGEAFRCRRSVDNATERVDTYTGPAIVYAVRLDPAHVLTAAIAPLGEDLAPTLEPIPGAAAYPEENEGWVRCERPERELLQCIPRE